jgi:pyroglutamyl-peptidase
MPSPAKIKVLVTGFGPFPGMYSNPSSSLMSWIEQRSNQLTPEVQLETVIIPTCWSEVDRFTSRTLADIDPDIALHFGVHSCSKIIRIEQLARNCTSTQADAMGKTATRTCVVGGAPQILKSTLSTKKLVTKLVKRKLPAQCSSNAGRYLCNALLFASLNQEKLRSTPRQTGFIHIPPLNAQGIKQVTLFKTAELIIAHCISRHTYQTLLRAGTIS